jgi:hypothetical protein
MGLETESESYMGRMMHEQEFRVQTFSRRGRATLKQSRNETGLF